MEIQIFRAKKGDLGPENQTGYREASYVEWHAASLWKYGLALSLADLSLGLTCTSVSQLATFAGFLLRSGHCSGWPEGGKYAEKHRPGAQGIWAGHTKSCHDMSPLCERTTTGQPQGGDGRIRVSWLSVEMGWNRRDLGSHLDLAFYKMCVCESVANSLLSLTFDFTQWKRG